jgi:hypothetical protein
VTDLPVCCGRDSILVVVDRCTKLAIFSACTKTISAPQLAQLFIDKIFVRFGMPTLLLVTGTHALPATSGGPL